MCVGSEQIVNVLFWATTASHERLRLGDFKPLIVSSIWLK